MAENVLPVFSEWTQEEGLTIFYIADYNIVFKTNTAWTGIYLWGTNIIRSGDVITFGVTSIDGFSEFSISDSTGETIGTVNTSKLSQTVTVTGTAPYDIYITISDPTQQATVMGAYLNIDSRGPEPDPPAETKNIKIGDSNVKIMLGGQTITKVYIGDTLIYSI